MKLNFEAIIWRIKNEPEWLLLGLLVVVLIVGLTTYFIHGRLTDDEEARLHFTGVFQGFLMAESPQDFQEVAANLQQLGSMYPRSELLDKIRFFQAKSLLEAGEYGQAIEQLRRFLHEHPESYFNPAARLNIAYAHYYLENFEQATSQLQALIRELDSVHPLWAEAVWQQARVYSQQENRVAQVETLEMLVEQIDPDQEYWYLRAREELIDLR